MRSSKSFFVTLVSSHKITSACFNASNALSVISLRFPMGVGTSVSTRLFHIIFLSKFFNAPCDVCNLITTGIEWVAKA